MAFCNNCGAQLEEGAVFCGSCGTPVAYTNPPTIPTPQPPKRTSDTVITVLAVILAAIAIFGAAYVIGMNFNSKDKEDNSAPQTTEATTPNIVRAGEYTEGYREPFVPYRNDYIFPSDRVLLTERDLDAMSKDKIAYVRNEIYARHGYIFHQEPYKSYFEAQSWYYPDRYFDESDFSSIEMQNKTFIVEYETRMGWR